MSKVLIYSFVHNLRSILISHINNGKFRVSTFPDATASLEPLDRLDALQRANVDLNRKCMEAERTLQHKLSEHELELEELQSRLEEVRSELAHTKREEKELRSKDVCFLFQFFNWEAMVADGLDCSA